MKNELISIGERNLQIKSWIKENNKKEKEQDFTRSFALDWIFQYTEFCHLNLNISMFVPAIKVGDKWEVLEMPKEIDMKVAECVSISNVTEQKRIQRQYQTALDNVIFEGFTYELAEMIINDSHLNSTIEFLIDYNLTLTKKGLEVSGLNR